MGSKGSKTKKQPTNSVKRVNDIPPSSFPTVVQHANRVYIPERVRVEQLVEQLVEQVSRDRLGAIPRPEVLSYIRDKAVYAEDPEKEIQELCNSIVNGRMCTAWDKMKKARHDMRQIEKAYIDACEEIASQDILADTIQGQITARLEMISELTTVIEDEQTTATNQPGSIPKSNITIKISELRLEISELQREKIMDRRKEMVVIARATKVVKDFMAAVKDYNKRAIHTRHPMYQRRDGKPPAAADIIARERVPPGLLPLCPKSVPMPETIALLSTSIPEPSAPLPPMPEPSAPPTLTGVEEPNPPPYSALLNIE